MSSESRSYFFIQIGLQASGNFQCGWSCGLKHNLLACYLVWNWSVILISVEPHSPLVWIYLFLKQPTRSVSTLDCSFALTQLAICDPMEHEVQYTMRVWRTWEVTLTPYFISFSFHIRSIMSWRGRRKGWNDNDKAECRYAKHRWQTYS